MARPIKDGVAYFPKDTDFYQDYKVRMLRAQFGAKGMYLIDYLLCEIYGKNGYFLPWNKDVQLLVADAVGCECSPQFLNEFVTGATKCGLFDKTVLDVFGVLTSVGIQRRYIRMFNSREKLNIIKEYWLLDNSNSSDVPTGILNKIAFIYLKSTGNPDKSTGNPDKSTGNPQSKKKVKESKLNESNKCASAKPTSGTHTHFKVPTVEEIQAYCKERNNNVNPEKFYDHYETNGWIVGKVKMKDWKAAVRTWEHNNYDKPKQAKQLPKNTSSSKKQKGDWDIINKFLNEEDKPDEEYS